MPPKATGSKTPQTRTSKSKQNIKTIQKDVDGKGQSLLEKENQSETVADLEVTKSNTMNLLTQTRDLVLEQALADAGLDVSSSSEEGGEEYESEPDQPFDIMARSSKFTKCDDITEMEEEEGSEVLPLDQIEMEDTFFQTFGAVPEVSELSEDEDVKVEAKETQHKAPITGEDKGEFVSPLLGQIVLPPDDRSADRIETISVEEKRPSERLSTRPSTLRSTRPSASDLTDKADAVDEVESEEAHEETDHEKFLEFLELEKQKEEAERALEGAAIEDLLRQEVERINYEQTMVFINKLIDMCVEMAEFTDENVILRKNLDKNKLMVELKAKLEVVEIERKIVQFLNRKCVEFYRRRSAFSKTIADYSPANQQKYYDALKNLDDWLNKEKKLKKESVARLQECKEQYEYVSKKLKYEVQQLEQLMKSTFCREKFGKLEAVVFQNVETMSKIRKEISEVRTKLIILQHDAITLRQQLTKMEDLGNGLFIKDYETLETETSALDEKLQERNTALNKLHYHMNYDVNNLAHLKEKQKMMRQFIYTQKQILNELLVERNEIKRYITKLKIKRNRNRYDIRQLSCQSGLLDKPVLMRDYDRTEESINKLRISNDDLKKNTNEIMKKIALLEDMNKRKNSKDSNTRS